MNDQANGVISQEPSPPAAAADSGASRRPGSGTTPRRRGADHYDTTLWRLLPKQEQIGQGFALGVTSCGRRAGASTVAANLAIRAADHKQSPVLLVDANLSDPSLARTFRLHDAVGLAEVLAEQCEPTEAIHDSGIEGLSVMPLGAGSLVDRTRVSQDCLAGLLAELRGEYATLVFDLPEEQNLRHSLLIAQQLDATLMVLRSESTRGGVAEAALSRLALADIKVVGSVLTHHKVHTPNWFQRWL